MQSGGDFEQLLKVHVYYPALGLTKPVDCECSPRPDLACLVTRVPSSGELRKGLHICIDDVTRRFHKRDAVRIHCSPTC